ncbi:MAG: site-specific DNA-methyltransferase [Bacillota bacterium]|nr:site-specific DNA-methyltransferase [Bacillota bacterium]
MSLIVQLPDILEESRKEREALMSRGEGPRGEGPSFSVTEEMRARGAGGKDSPPENLIVRGENAAFMEYLLREKGMAGKLQLIYIDPPFFSKSDYGAEIKLFSGKGGKLPVMKQQAYPDTWEKGMGEYLRMMALRFFLMRELLSEEGALWVHADWHAVHYLKVLLDEIFGEKNFVNEVVWQYKSGGASKRRFARKHDTLLFYAKSPDYYFQAQQEISYNRGYKPYRFKGVKEYRDELGWYTMVNRKDVWQLDMVGRTSAERTGYVTQKPETLVRRILESCTREGDLCADFFGGSGTMAAAAQDMGRRWISCDVGKLAAVNTLKRMTEKGGGFTFLEEDGGAEEGVLKADITLQAGVVSDTMELNIRLTDYAPASLEEIPVEEKYLPAIEKLLREDPLQLVDYWSVDWAWDGRVHRPQACFCKGKERVTDCCGTIAASPGPVSVRAVDIFGNTARLIREV